jgi:hypothetical protein
MSSNLCIEIIRKGKRAVTPLFLVSSLPLFLFFHPLIPDP